METGRTSTRKTFIEKQECYLFIRLLKQIRRFPLYSVQNIHYQNYYANFL